MVGYVTETLKDARIKKVRVTDVAVANTKSTRLPTGLQRPVVDRLVGKAQHAPCLRIEQRSTRALETHVRRACSSLTCGSAVRRERAGVVQHTGHRGPHEDQEQR